MRNVFMWKCEKCSHIKTAQILYFYLSLSLHFLSTVLDNITCECGISVVRVTDKCWAISNWQSTVENSMLRCRGNMIGLPICCLFPSIYLRVCVCTRVCVCMREYGCAQSMLPKLSNHKRNSAFSFSHSSAFGVQLRTIRSTYADESIRELIAATTPM